MHSSEFNSVYLNDLLKKLSHENNKIILMGDFNIDLLKYDTQGDSSDFLDAINPAGKYWSPGRPEDVPLQRPQDVP